MEDEPFIKQLLQLNDKEFLCLIVLVIQRVRLRHNPIQIARLHSFTVPPNHIPTHGFGIYDNFDVTNETSVSGNPNP